VNSEILSISGWRKLAQAAELPIKVGEIRQSNLLRNQVYRKIGFTQAHARAADAKFT
jgi:hypothetical protein